MSKNYNETIAKLGALVNATASEISNDNSLLKGEKYLLLQRILLEIKPLQKNFENIEEELKGHALKNLKDEGSGESKTLDFEGAEILIKYSYPKPTLDAELLKEELARVYAEINTEFNEYQFLKESTPRKRVIIQKKLNQF